MSEALTTQALDMQRRLEAQQAAFRAEAGADARVRRDRLGRAIALLVDHQVAICEALAEIVPQPLGVVGPSEVAVVTGGAEVAQAFSQLPFDHLMFTGSTSIGRRVMAAVAEHLVTLELGGKCPVLIGRSAPLARTVDRILLGKLTNTGQMCIAADYLLLPEDMLEPFAREAASSGRSCPCGPIGRSAPRAERILKWLIRR